MMALLIELVDTTLGALSYFKITAVLNGFN